MNLKGRDFLKLLDYTPEEIEDALKEAGFREVKSDHHPSRPWITVLAVK